MSNEFGRRSFLKRLLGGAAGAVAAATAGELLNLTALDGKGVELLDPERLLWTPGAKSFFYPDTDLKVRNIREATPQEVAQVTGQHYVRVKFLDQAPAYDGKIVDARGHLIEIDPDAALAGTAFGRASALSSQSGRTVEQIVLMTEAEFARTGAVAFANARDVNGNNLIEVHYDNGTIARNFPPNLAPQVAELKAQLAESHARKIALMRKSDLERRRNRMYFSEPDDCEDWTRPPQGPDGVQLRRGLPPMPKRQPKLPKLPPPVKAKP